MTNSIQSRSYHIPDTWSIPPPLPPTHWFFTACFIPLGLEKEILNSIWLLISLINTRNKHTKSLSHPTSSFLWLKWRTKCTTPVCPEVIKKHGFQTTNVSQQTNKKLEAPNWFKTQSPKQEWKIVVPWKLFLGLLAGSPQLQLSKYFQLINVTLFKFYIPIQVQEYTQKYLNTFKVCKRSQIQGSYIYSSITSQ